MSRRERWGGSRGSTLLALLLAGAAVFAVQGSLVWGGRVVQFAAAGDFPPWTAMAAQGLERPTLVQDALRYSYPAWEFAHAEIHEGRLPLWNPLIFSGHDQAATLQAAAFSPVTILFSLFSPARGMSLHLLFHTLLLATGTAWFLRGRGAGAWGAVAAALVATSTGYLLSKMGQPTTISTLAWFPWLGGLQDQWLRRPAWPHSALMALGLAAAFLSGHGQIFVLGCGMLVVLGAGQLIRQGISRQGIARLAAPALAVLLLAASLSAVQWVSFLTTEEMTRTVGSEEGPKLARAEPAALWALPVPEPFGSAAEGTFSPPVEGRLSVSHLWHAGWQTYPGALPLLLIPCALAGLRRWWTLEALGLVALSFAAVHFRPLHHLLQEWVPGLGIGRMDRYLAIGALGLAFLAAAGLQEFWRLRTSRAVGLAGGATAVYLAVLLWMLSRETFAAGRSSILRTMGMAGLALAGLLLARLARARSAALAGAILVLVLAVDVVPLGRKSFPTTSSPAPLAETASIRFLREHLADGRILRWRTEALAPNTAQVFGLHDAQGAAPLYAASYRRFYSLLERPDSAGFRHARSLSSAEALHSPLLSLLAVRYVLAPAPIPEAGWQTVQAEPGLAVVAYPGTAPRARLVERWTEAPSLDEAARLVGAGAFDPLGEVVLGPDDAQPGRMPAKQGPSATPRSDPDARVWILQETPRLVELAVESAAGGMLVLADSFHPYWRASMDGQTVSIRRANLAFRAVRVPPGAVRVTFRYVPTAIYWAGGFSSLSALLVLAALLRHLLGRRAAPGLS